ncbi:MAG: branched-chain amino acid ABC transporter permease [Actinomycetales bacterium]|nr:branched-chain amino acid ABC transporter permease [Actinomycetales bacterium]
MDWSAVLGQALTQAVGIQAIIYCLAAIGLNMQFGYTGLLNFGQAGFAAVGAYAIAVLVVTFDWGLWPSMAMGILGAIVLALLLGVPTLRLRADYLAIVTIAAAEVIRLVSRSVTFNDVFGGSDGITGKFAAEFYALNPFIAVDPEFSGLTLGPLRYTRNDSWIWLAGWALIAIVLLIFWLLVRSPWGRVLKSIREDEDAARSLGKNVYLYKMESLIIGGVIGALAGFVFAASSQSVQPDNYATALTFFAYTVLILGGAARVLGPVAGTIVFWFLIVFIGEFLTGALRAGWIPDELLRPDQIGQVRFMLVGLGLMLLMIFRPQGMFGDRRELALDAR